MVVEIPESVRPYLQSPKSVLAVKWPSEWRDQAVVAKYLGQAGIVFQFEDGHQEPHANQYDPQLYLFTRRYDRINIRVGDYIVLKGEGRFVVVDKEDFFDEYLVSSE